MAASMRLSLQSAPRQNGVAAVGRVAVGEDVVVAERENPAPVRRPGPDGPGRDIRLAAGDADRNRAAEAAAGVRALGRQSVLVPGRMSQGVDRPDDLGHHLHAREAAGQERCARALQVDLHHGVTQGVPPDGRADDPGPVDELGREVGLGVQRRGQVGDAVPMAEELMDDGRHARGEDPRILGAVYRQPSHKNGRAYRQRRYEIPGPSRHGSSLSSPNGRAVARPVTCVRLYVMGRQKGS